ncbi:hypothetical protein JTB14_029557 [Gonioctena quinquepunctata]|nr:hypothetical protein JTB14_029557 [Gonioctena quinquepunctata]
MMERLLRDMQTIKLDVRNLVLELNNNKLTQYQQLDAQLRFKDYEELQKFNESLLEEDCFIKMQSSISLLGGRDLNDTTRKILSLLVSHELSLNINWIEANEKGSFQKHVNVLKLTYDGSLGVSNVKEKGIASLLKASEKRKDGKWASLRGKTSVRVHDECRKSYTNERTILAHIKMRDEFVETHKPRETRSTVPDFASRTNCFICGLIITKQFLAAEAKKPPAICELLCTRFAI